MWNYDVVACAQLSASEFSQCARLFTFVLRFLVTWNMVICISRLEGVLKFRIHNAVQGNAIFKPKINAKVLNLESMASAVPVPWGVGPTESLLAQVSGAALCNRALFLPALPLQACSGHSA